MLCIIIVNMVGPGWRIAAALFLVLSLEGFSQSDSGRLGSLATTADTISDAVNVRVDSLFSQANEELGLLRKQYDSVITTASSNLGNIQRSIDSLAIKGVVNEQYAARVDSVKTRVVVVIDSLAGRMESIRTELTSKLQEMNLPPEVMSGVTTRISALSSFAPDRVGSEIPGLPQFPQIPGQSALNNVALPATDISMPALDVALPTDAVVSGAPNLGLPSGDISNATNPLAGALPESVAGLSEHVPSLPGELPTLSQHAPTLSGQVPLDQVSNIIPTNIDALTPELEGRAEALAGTTGVTDQMQLANGAMPALPADEELAKEELKSQAQKVAVNHFAGKEDQLQQAMDKLAVLKKKYGSFQSLADLPKKVPNPMSSKPFVERLVPGLLFQVGRNDNWLFDINLYLGYRFTGRITAGAGWNQRIAYNGDANTFQSQPVIYGPRAYGEYDIGKGFSGRLELEYMNTYVPPQFASNPDNPAGREWVFGTLAGMKKSYTITRRLKGTVVVMYNVYDPHHRSPYKNRLNGRFGVEWGIRAKTQ